MSAPAANTKPRWWAVRPPRTDTALLSTRRAYLEILVVYAAFFAASIAAAGFAVAGDAPTQTISGWADAVPGAIDQFAVTVLCIVVPILVVRRRGLGRADLGLTKPANVSVSQGIRIAAWAVLGLIAGSIVTSSLATGSYDYGTFSYPQLTVNLFAAAQAGFIEEIVVLAFVVTTLEQARRPRAEIVAVALILRASYHIYYGPGVVGIFIWASVFLWLFLRFRTIVPLILVHSTWDFLIMLANRWKFVAGLDVLAWIALFIAAFVLWLVDRGSRAQPSPLPMRAPPGWYADPAGSVGLRYFDGWYWAPDVHYR
jgi:hypothetical protein